MDDRWHLLMVKCDLCHDRVKLNDAVSKADEMT
jgi:hypothetical protein